MGSSRVLESELEPADRGGVVERVVARPSRSRDTARAARTGRRGARHVRPSASEASTARRASSSAASGPTARRRRGGRRRRRTGHRSRRCTSSSTETRHRVEEDQCGGVVRRARMRKGLGLDDVGMVRGLRPRPALGCGRLTLLRERHPVVQALAQPLGVDPAAVGDLHQVLVAHELARVLGDRPTAAASAARAPPSGSTRSHRASTRSTRNPRNGLARSTAARSAVGSRRARSAGSIARRAGRRPPRRSRELCSHS